MDVIACVVLLWLVPGLGAGQGNNLDINGTPGELGEFCDRETFRAQCDPGHVVLIRVARYGRMRKGRCIGDDYVTGCSVDAREYLQMACSGRQTCAVPVVSLVPTQEQPCDSDLRSYLQAMYACVPVAQADPAYCRRGGQLQVTNPSGYLSGLMTNTTNCGSMLSPWLILAKPGQMIRLRLLDYDPASPRNSAGMRNCQVKAVFRDSLGSRKETVCSEGPGREQEFVFNTNAVEVRMVVRKDETSKYFLVEYEAIGCPDLTPPTEGWVQRSADVIQMGCNNSDLKWRMECDGQKWIGNRRNCTKGAVAGASSPVMWDVFTRSHGISIITILVIALVVGLVIMAFGLLYLKKCRQRTARAAQQQQERRLPVPQEQLYPPATKAGYPVPKTPDGESIQTYQSTGNDYYRTWQLSRHGGHGGGQGGSGSSGIGSALSPPPYSDQQSSRNSQTYAEHIYESPKFERKGVRSLGFGADPETPTEYYELDPESVDPGFPTGPARHPTT